MTETPFIPPPVSYKVKLDTGGQNNLLYHQFPIKIRRCRHGNMMFLETDKYVGGSLDLYGEYCESEATMFQQLVSPGNVVIDAGANIGAHTVLFAKLVGAQGHVYAFEPQGRIYHLLCSNLALNGIENTDAYNCCVGEKLDRVSIPLVDYNRFNNFGGVGVGVEYWRQEAVDVMTIDSLDAPRCDFIKIDVEGMERQVLLGAAETVRRFQPVMWVEDDRDDLSTALRAEIKRLGYRLYACDAPYYSGDNFYKNPQNMFGAQCAKSLLCVPERLKDVQILGLAEV